MPTKRKLSQQEKTELLRKKKMADIERQKNSGKLKVRKLSGEEKKKWDEHFAARQREIAEREAHKRALGRA
jgi:predicted transcriptional regulator